MIQRPVCNVVAARPEALSACSRVIRVICGPFAFFALSLSRFAAVAQVQEALMSAPMGLDPGHLYPPQFGNDAIPASNHRMGMAGSSHDGVGNTWTHEIGSQSG